MKSWNVLLDYESKRFCDVHDKDGEFNWIHYNVQPQYSENELIIN